MSNRDDEFQKLFREIEKDYRVEGNVVSFANNRSAKPKRYTPKRTEDEKVIPISSKRKTNMTKEEAKRLKIMSKYERQLQKIEAKKKKLEYKQQAKLDNQDRKSGKKAKTVKITEKSEDKKHFNSKAQEDKQRLTPPKKRNFITRFSHMRKYVNDDLDYECIENDIEDYKKGELSDDYMKSQWDEIQEYEDAKDDVALRRGWTAFKLALAGIALAGSLFACKTMYNNITQDFQNMQTVSAENAERESVEYTAKRAHAANLRLEDQQFFYQYTDGNPSLENWEKLPTEVQENVRNPVTAAEAAAKYDNDQSHFYVMTDGDFTTEAWEKLPNELKLYIREPVSTAKEYYEEGKDQVYLYKLSRGAITEEFWNTLPEEVKQYVRNPVELAKEFAENGDVSGYLDAVLKDDNRSDKDKHLFWSFLPDELKEYVQDPSLMQSEQDLQKHTEDEIGER